MTASLKFAQALSRHDGGFITVDDVMVRVQ